jgi:hypothetical protein
MTSRLASSAASAEVNTYASTTCHVNYDKSTHQQRKKGSVHLPIMHNTMQHNTHLAMLQSSDFVVQAKEASCVQTLCGSVYIYTKQLETKVSLSSLYNL